MNKLCVAGIDPGETGAVVVMDFDRSILYMQHFDGMGDEALQTQIRLIASNFRPQAILKEEFFSYGVDGKRSFFVGRIHGIIDVTVREQGLRQINVKAQEWQKDVFPKGREATKPKFLSLETVSECFGDVELRVKTKTGKLSKNPHMGLCDALLIAAHGVNLLLKETGAHSKSLAW